MPKRNIKALGDAVQTVFPQGFLRSVNREADEATVDIEGYGVYAGVPIFYHCSDDAAQRPSGALVNGAAPFKSGDKVVVMAREPEGGSRLEGVCVVGFASGEVKPCAGRPVVFVVLEFIKTPNEDGRYDYYGDQGEFRETCQFWDTSSGITWIDPGAPHAGGGIRPPAAAPVWDDVYSLRYYRVSPDGSTEEIAESEASKTHHLVDIWDVLLWRRSLVYWQGGAKDTSDPGRHDWGQNGVRAVGHQAIGPYSQHVVSLPDGTTLSVAKSMPGFAAWTHEGGKYVLNKPERVSVEEVYKPPESALPGTTECHDSPLWYQFYMRFNDGSRHYPLLASVRCSGAVLFKNSTRASGCDGQDIYQVEDVTHTEANAYIAAKAAECNYNFPNVTGVPFSEYFAGKGGYAGYGCKKRGGRQCRQVGQRPGAPAHYSLELRGTALATSANSVVDAVNNKKDMFLSESRMVSVGAVPASQCRVSVSQNGERDFTVYYIGIDPVGPNIDRSCNSWDLSTAAYVDYEGQEMRDRVTIGAKFRVVDGVVVDGDIVENNTSEEFYDSITEGGYNEYGECEPLIVDDTSGIAIKGTYFRYGMNDCFVDGSGGGYYTPAGDPSEKCSYELADTGEFMIANAESEGSFSPLGGFDAPSNISRPCLLIPK